MVGERSYSSWQTPPRSVGGLGRLSTQNDPKSHRKEGPERGQDRLEAAGPWGGLESSPRPDQALVSKQDRKQEGSRREGPGTGLQFPSFNNSTTLTGRYWFPGTQV